MKEDILKSYNLVSNNYIGNSNSLHKLGLDSKRLEDAAGKQILDVLGLDGYDVIYTSGNAESMSTILFNVFGDIDVEFSATDVNHFGKYSHINVNLNNNYCDLNYYDFITIEDDIPFFGVLLKKKNIDIKPIICGGKSSTKYRSGTAATSLIVSFSKLVKFKYKK